MKTSRVLPIYLIVFIACLFGSSTLAQNDLEAMSSVQQEQAKGKHYTQVVDSYLRGLADKDLEAILFLYADNATVEDPVGSKIVSGMPALREFYTGAVGFDLQLTRTGPVRVAGMEAAFPFELRMKVNGKAMKTDIIDVFRFNEDGKIISMRAFWGPTNQTPAEE